MRTSFHLDSIKLDINKSAPPKTAKGQQQKVKIKTVKPEKTTIFWLEKMAGTNTLYLEHYLDSLESLPRELRRNFTLMHDLDLKNKTILQDVDAASDEYLRKVNL